LEAIRRPSCATRSIRATATGLSRNVASAASTNGRGRLVPAGLVGEIVLGEAVEHQLEPARVEIVLRGLLQRRKRVEQLEPVPGVQADHAWACRRRERDEVV